MLGSDTVYIVVSFVAQKWCVKSLIPACIMNSSRRSDDLAGFPNDLHDEVDVHIFKRREHASLLFVSGTPEGRPRFGWMNSNSSTTQLDLLPGGNPTESE